MLADYPAGMAKARVRKPVGRKNKAPADDAIVRDDGSVLPPKKPPAPEVSPKTRTQGKAAEVIVARPHERPMLR
jgi:hypothetical protein